MQKNDIPLCWIPNSDAQNAKMEKTNAVLRRVLEVGLWNVPKILVKESFTNIYEDRSFMNGFFPNKTMPLLVAVHEYLDRLFIISHIETLMEFDTPKIFEEKLKEHLYTLFGDKAGEFCSEISLCYAQADLIFKDEDFFKKLLNSNITPYASCLKGKEPWDIDFMNTFAYSTNWNLKQKILVFMAEQPLSQLSPWRPQGQKSQFSYKNILLKGDAIRADLPILEENILTDVNKGHWDLFQPSNIVDDYASYDLLDTKNSFVARNPLADVQSNSLVSIDFGTSSTVVAIRNEDRSIMLQRIGMQSQAQKVEAKHFQNPTVLEFLDFTSFMDNWKAVPYRPLIQWRDVCCSHKAKNEIYNTTVDTKAINSGLASLKTWAKRKEDNAPMRLRDQQGVEITLSPLIIYDNDTVLEDFSHNDFNPIELYAYFIGLNLNNQAYYGGRIFQEYYLTFPIKFDRATRDGILFSFRRGLMRSLPPALAYTPNWIKENFIVEEYANEPTAYAAAAFGEIKDIQPTEDGIAFGVFDFGGGTTDFSFGLYRLATARENEDNGYEVVLDILDTAGDEDLGGEHLLQGMNTCIIEKNIDILLEKNIPFTFPPHTHFHGQEALMDSGNIASCNTIKLNEMLRPFWEEGSLADDESGTISCTFFNKANETESITLTICTEDLENYLITRISKGVMAFFTAYAQAFKKENILHPEHFHVLQAGNSCRSPLVQRAFDQVLDEIKNKESALEDIRDAIILHPPLFADEKQFNKPNMKTGVALGLLKIAPGETLGVVERLDSGEESPFRFSVGRFVSDILNPILQRNCPYGQWFELGTVKTNGVDVIGYSLKPEALEGKVTKDDCLNFRHKWDKKHAKRKILIQAYAPDTIALALANEDNSPDENNIFYHSLT